MFGRLAPIHSPKVWPEVAGEVQLNIDGLAVGALRGGRREWIAPEILNVLHMLRVVFQLTNQTVVVPVSIVAEALLPSKTIIATLSESDSLKSSPMRSSPCTTAHLRDSAIPNALSRPAPAGGRRHSR